jgi:hypothetical protein
VIGSGGWVEDLGNGHSVMVMIPDLIDLDDNLDAPSRPLCRSGAGAAR